MTSKDTSQSSSEGNEAEDKGIILQLAETLQAGDLHEWAKTTTAASTQPAGTEPSDASVKGQGVDSKAEQPHGSQNAGEDERANEEESINRPRGQSSFLNPGPAPTLGFDDVCGLADEKQELTETILDSALRPRTDGFRTVSAVFYGPTDAGKRRLARALAGELGEHGFEYDHVRTLQRDDGSAIDSIREVVTEARAHEPMVVLLDCFQELHHHSTPHELMELLADLRQSTTQVVLLGVMNEETIHSKLIEDHFRNFDIRFKLDQPDLVRRRELLEAELNRGRDSEALTVDQDDLDLDMVARSTEGFGVSELRTLVRRVALQAGDEVIDTGTFQRITDQVNSERIESAQARNAVQDIDVSTVGFEDVGGLDDAKERLREILELPLIWEDAYERFDLPTNSGILLHGPPGNGKTLLAKAVANETGRTFISISGPELKNVFGGGTESRLRSLFEKARRNAPAVVFFDEFDSIGVERGQYHGGKDDVVNTLLTELDGLQGNDDVVVIAATNRMDILDEALLRPGRFDHLVPVMPPGDSAQREVFDVHTESLPLADDVTARWFVSVATDGLSGADIATICNQAGVIALRNTDVNATVDELTVRREDFRQALVEFSESRSHVEGASERGFQ